MGDLWSQVWTVVAEELSPPPLADLTRTCIRLSVAALLGAVVGYDRERKDSAAGLRTHMLVALGAALFVIAAEQAGMDNADLSRVMQGIIAGIGFLGAGAIIKLSEKEEIKGLTTAASVWATAAIGLTAGMGHEVTAGLSALLVLVILAVLPRIERHINRKHVIGTPDRDGAPPDASRS